MPGKEADKTARDILRVLFRRWRLFVLAASLFMILAFVMSLHIPKQYTAQARFILGTDPAADRLASAQAASFAAIEQRIDLMIRSNEFVEEAINVVEGDPDFAGLSGGFTVLRGLPHEGGELTEAGQRMKQNIIREVTQNLIVSRERRAAGLEQLVVSVRFTSPNAEFAHRLPNVLVRNYQQRVYDEILKTLSDSRATVQKQYDTILRDLNLKKQERYDYEKEHAGSFVDSVSALYENIQRVETGIERLTHDLNNARIRQQAVASKKSEIESLLSDSALDASDDTPEGRQPVQEVVGPNPEYRKTLDEIERARQGLENLRTLQGKRDSHPDVILQRQSIAMLEAKLEDTPEEIVLQRVYSTLAGRGGPNDLLIAQASARAELETLTSEIEAGQNELNRLSALQEHYQSILSQYVTVRKEYERLNEEQRNLEADLQGTRRQLRDLSQHHDLQVVNRRTDVNQIEMARRPFRPSYPAISMIVMIAVGGGLAFATAVVMGSNMLERTIATTEEASRLFDFPIHGVISEIQTRRQQAARRLRRLTLTPLLAAALSVAIGWFAWGAYLRIEDPQGFNDWRRDPAGLLSSQIADPVRALLGRTRPVVQEDAMPEEAEAAPSDKQAKAGR